MRACDGTAANTGFTALGHGERMAVWTLRWLVDGPQSCGRLAATFWGDASLADTAPVLRQVMAARLACAGSLSLTRDERRMLRALTAAQAEDEMLLDNSLYKIALDGQLRAGLARAVRSLAAILAAHGHWLRQPA